MGRGVDPGVTLEKRCLATALRTAQRGARCSGSHLEKFPASLAEKGKGVHPPARTRLSKQLKVPDEEGGGSQTGGEENLSFPA